MFRDSGKLNAHQLGSFCDRIEVTSRADNAWDPSFYNSGFLCRNFLLGFPENILVVKANTGDGGMYELGPLNNVGGV
jgi:hypothetical protein